MQMPIDFEVTDQDDRVHKFHISNTWFTKETDATILTKWTGFGDLNKTHEVEISIPEGIHRIEIDPSHRLADVNMLNNTTGSPIVFEFDHQLRNRSDWTKYELKARPDIWYNGYDGFKFGVHLNGGHFNLNHRFNLYVWANSGLGQWDVPSSVELNQFMPMSLLFDYKTSLSRYWNNSEIDVSGRVLDGLYNTELGFTKWNKKKNTSYRVYFRSLYRHTQRDIAYLLNRITWGSEKWNNSFNVEIQHNYQYNKGQGSVLAQLRSSALGSDRDYHYLRITAENRTNLWRLKLNTRVVGQIGTGSDWAPESLLYLGGANPEEMMYNKYMRSAGIFPSQWANFQETSNYLHYGGGLNLRGYVGYLAPENVDDEIILAYVGHSGAAINAELEFDDIFGLRPKWTRKWLDVGLYLFADVGFISTSDAGDNFSFASPRADAGLGATVTIKKWGVLEKTKPLTIRFDMPFFLNRTPALDSDPWAFRWLIGINKAF
jgi:aminopeptidase N